ncbi:uncharacterized protein [Glycine max]|uniref:uncharacterized protein n=1 Tax=Glycine max TaxID=3847 RepID=UPI0003DE8350|nr:uncharacterized protein LOC102664104 [Glycine max]|eukprot:XP_006596644.1 uncharacterized protein LOC102664104 [Glycine max]
MEPTTDTDYDEDSSRACRWIATKKTVKSICTPTYRECLDRLRILDVCWISYGEHRPVSFDDIHDRWMDYSDHMVAADDSCVMPGQCASDYMDWFFRISHPFMTSGQPSDPQADDHAT